MIVERDSPTGEVKEAQRMIWKATKIDAHYEVSNDGQIRKRINIAHPERNKPYVYLRQQTDKDGYKKVTINKKHHFIHRLVYEVFVGPLNANLVVCHRNNDKTDNSPQNLLQATQKENISHKKLHGTWQSADQHPKAAISNEIARAIKKDLAFAPRSQTGRLKRGWGKRLQMKHGVSIHIIYGINHGGWIDA